MSSTSPRRVAAVQAALLCPVCEKKFPLYGCQSNVATNHINNCIASLERKMKRGESKRAKNKKKKKDENSLGTKRTRSDVSKKRKSGEYLNDDVRPPKKGRSNVSEKKKSSRKSASSINLSTSSTSSMPSTKKSISLKKPTQKMISPFIQHVLASQGKSREMECTCRGKSVTIDLLTLEGYDAFRECMMDIFLTGHDEDFDDLDIAYLDKEQRCLWLSDGSKGSKQQQQKSQNSSMKENDWFKFCSTVQKVFVYLRRGPIY